MEARSERSNRSKNKDAGTVAQAYLALLADRGVDYLFGNAGTDFAPLIEAYAQAAQTGVAVPRPVLATHENLAVTMAHGYGMVSRRIPAVMVHVSVGTANMICAAMNASRENVAILLTAGRSPLTEEGLAGSRDGYIHWAQEMYDQAGMIREIVKWDYELRNPEQLTTVVDRALVGDPAPMLRDRVGIELAFELRSERRERRQGAAGDGDVAGKAADRVTRIERVEPALDHLAIRSGGDPARDPRNVALDHQNCIGVRHEPRWIEREVHGMRRGQGEITRAMLDDRYGEALGELRERRERRRIPSGIRRHDQRPLRPRQHARGRDHRVGVRRRRRRCAEPRR